MGEEMLTEAMAQSFGLLKPLPDTLQKRAITLEPLFDFNALSFWDAQFLGYEDHSLPS